MSIKSLKNQSFTNKSYFNSINLSGGAGGTAAPVITSIIICDSNYNNLDDTALAPGGSYVKLIGTGFKTGCTVYFNNESLTATFISSSEVRIQTPATTVGSYNIMLFNPGTDGGAIYLNLSVSNAPTWTTNAGSLGTQYETTSVNTSVSATGDTPITYSLFSGNLPAGTTLSSDGTLSGTAPAETSSTTYSFTVNAKDAQNQDTTRTFSLTINVDVVSWTTPTDNQLISSYEYSPISNVTLLASSAAGYNANNYTANALPTGITLAGNTISGTANTTGNTYTRLTATSNTSGRSATRDVVFNVNQDVVTWSSPADGTQYTLSGGSPISNVSLSATSAAGRTISYTANTLPSGLSLSGSTIFGTPDTAQTVTTLLTATADTTNRSATRTISWSISLGDLNWKNTVLMLSANTPTPSFINDSSNNNLQLTIVGDTRPSNFDPYINGYYSTYFNGSSSQYSSSYSIPIGTNDFTMEFWIYFTGTDGTRYDILSADSSAQIVFYRFSDNTFNFYWNTTNRISVSGFTAAAYGNRWVHVALVKSSGSTKLYFNGTQVGSTYTDSNDYGTFTSLYLGSNTNSIYYLGYISNFRIVTGTALYTSNFTPPSTSLTAIANTAFLTCQSNRFVENSNRNFPITLGGTPVISHTHPFTTPTTVTYNTLYSTYFDGSGDYLEIPHNTNQWIGAGVNFTIECWIYLPSAQTGEHVILAKGYQGSPAYGEFILTTGTSANQTIQFLASTDGGTFGINILDSTTLVPQTWYHIAAVRNGSTISLYKNGVSVGTPVTNSGALYNHTGTIRIGSHASGSGFIGHISNVRLNIGTALYTSNFTPPTAPLTAVANTRLLTCQSSTSIDNSTSNFAITSAGQAQPIAVSPFTMTTSNTTVTSLGSGYFDGTGDYLTLSTPLVRATGNFTIECWIYSLTAAGSAQRAVYSQFASAQTGRFMFGIDQTSSSRIWLHYNGADYVGTSGKIVANAWTHIALVRVGDAFDMYVNGVKDRTDTFTGASLYQGAQQIAGATGASFTPNAYISDLRIVSGTALYTANFLPTQSPLTPIANTQILTLQTNGGAINNSIMDQSVFSNIITRAGNATQGTFSPYSQNGWSNYFDGTGDYLTLPTNAAFAIGTADFTVEMWVMPTGDNLPWTTLFAGVNYGASSDWGLYGGDSATSLYPMFFFTSSSSQGSGTNQTQGSQSLTGYTKMTIGQWNHIAVSRVSGTARMFLNGTQTGPSVNASTWSLTNSLQKGIGGGFNGNSNTLFTGYISNLRVVSGTGLYSANFTPSTTPLSTVPGTILLTCQDNRLIDESPNNFTITRAGDVSVRALSPFGSVTSVPTSYSAYFDGTGDYLTVPDNTSLQMGSGDFTIEFWIYYNSITGYQTPFSKGYTAAGDILFQTGNGNGIMVIYLSGSIVIQESTGAVTGQWYHYALVRSGTTVTLYRDGVSRGTATNSVNFNTTNQLGIGATGKAPGGGAVGDYAVNGYMSNVRVVKGTAVYTGPFTPPTSPLTVIANTSLLTCQNATFIDNSTNYFTVSSNGNVKPLTFNPFGQTSATGIPYSPSVNGGSMFFDGTGDYLTAPSSATIYGTMAYTIEFWIYRTAAPATSRILENGTSTTNFSMDLNTSGFFTINNNTTIAGSTSTIAVPLNAWTHVALVRTSTGASGTAWYINGVAAGTFTHSVDITIGTTMQIARAAAGSHLTGYLSDLRFTQGIALYTSSFVPPVSPLTPTTTIGNTRYTSNLLLNGTSGGVIDYHGTNNLETVGNTQLTPLDPYGGTYYSVYSDGNGDYLTVPSATWTTLAGTFTVEFWALWTIAPASAGSFMGVQANGGWTLYNDNSGISPNIFGSGNIFNSTFSPSSIVPGRWYHIAVTRNSSNLMTMWVNGVSVGSTTTSASYTQGDWAIHSPGNVNLLNGYISNLRITNTTLYTETFTPSTSPLTAVSGTQLLTCQSNSFRDNSTNAATLTAYNTVSVKPINPFQRNTGKSIYFDGTGDSLYQVASPNYTFGTGDFTIEFWLYFNSTSNRQDLIWISTTGAATDRLGISWNLSAGNLTYYISPTIGNAINYAWTPVAGQWYHIALCRASGSTKLFVNGTQGGSTYSDSRNYNSQYAVYIGQDSTGLTSMFNGYLKDLRITRGARYTTTFTPPTTPFEVK